MHAKPTAINHQLVATASIKPNTAATPNAANAACFTSFGFFAPEPTRRIGPTRSISVPRMPSE